MSGTGRAEENCEYETSERKPKEQHDQKEEMREGMANMSSGEGEM